MDQYAFFCFVRELPQLLSATNLLADSLRASGNVAGADRVVSAYGALREGLVAMEATVAAEGTKILRDHERSSRVRPDTLGQGGPRLGDHLHVDSLGSILWGSIGVANETELDAEVPWWPTNEVGSSARIGGVLHGLFQPGGAPPEGASFRQHPIFESTGEGGEGGMGVIHNPIPARRFIERSIPDIEAAWRAGFGALKTTFMAEVALAQTAPGRAP